MKKITTVLAIFLFIPSISSAAALTSQQANSLIAVVQSSPSTPASVFVPLITSFSNITVNQAISLISVVQTAPSVPASAFVNLLISFTVDTTTVQSTTPAVTPIATTQSTQTNQIAVQKQQMIQSDEQQIQQEKTVIGGIDLQIATCNAKAAAIANQINNPNGAASTMDQLNGEISMQETANTANCTAPAESQLASEELKLSDLTDSLQIAESIVVP